MKAVDAPMTTVPFRGTGPAMQELLAGRIDLMCDQTTNTTEQINERRDQGLRRHHRGPAAVAARTCRPRRRPGCRPSR